MATVQHLEKLYVMQKAFQTDDTLEAAVARERVTQLIAKTEKLIYRRAFLRDERRRLRMMSEEIDDKQKALALMSREDWLPPDVAVNAPTACSDAHVQINIGGLMFEAPKAVLTRDGDSLLAKLCSDKPPVQPDPDGFFFFDRDWWLFRYILSFLRDGTLPDERGLLAELYREATFWELKQLQLAIEENKLNLRGTKPDTAVWWRKQPSWWQAIDEAKKKAADDAAAAAKAAASKKSDWWLDTAYNGKVFLPLSSAPDKVVTKAGEKDQMKTTMQTWSVPKSKD